MARDVTAGGLAARGVWFDVGLSEGTQMWVEICMVALVLVVLLQSLLVGLLWRQAGQLRTALTAVGRSAAHAAGTDVPTSMLVTALGRLEHRISLLELPVSTLPRSSYELAQQLAREGANADQLVARCGLSRDEATLIVQMHSGAA